MAYTMHRKSYLLLLSACLALTMNGSCRTRKSHESTEVLAAKSIETTSLTPGTYVGFLRLKEAKQKIPLSMEWLLEKGRKEQAEYKSIVRLNLGHHNSNESFTEVHEGIILDRASKKIYFPHVAAKLEFKDIGLKSATIITGSITSRDDPTSSTETSKDIGDFMVVYSGGSMRPKLVDLVAKMYPDIVVAPTLGGSYEGRCEAKKATLAIDSVRWPSTSSQVNHNFFRDYRFNITLAKEDDALCGKSALCTKGLYSDAQMSLSSMQVNLMGRPKPRLCQIDGTGLSCDTCKFTKIEDPKHPATTVSENLQKFLNRKGRESVPELKKGTSIGRSPDYPGAVAGEYFGYLHHENSGRYQLVRLKIEADYDRESSMKKQGLVVNAVATAFYGDQSSPEFAVYKFGPSYFSESSPQFIFNGPGESIIQVSSWYEHGLKALWYGKSHGRLGTIELLRDKIPHLRSQSKLMSRFSGSYVGTQTNIDLYSQADISLSHNDFFPLPTKGVMTGRNQSGKKSMIQALSFDPYSDRLAFDMLDGRMLIGVRRKGGFVLNWSEANQYGSAVNTTTEETYTQTSASIPTKTATNNEGRP